MSTAPSTPADVAAVDVVPGHHTITIATARLSPAQWAWDAAASVLLVDVATAIDVDSLGATIAGALSRLFGG